MLHSSNTIKKHNFLFEKKNIQMAQNKVYKPKITSAKTNYNELSSQQRKLKNGNSAKSGLVKLQFLGTNNGKSDCVD